MKKALIKIVVLSIALMGIWSLWTIHGHSGVQRASDISVQCGLYARALWTYLEWPFASLYKTSPLSIADEKGEEPQPETKVEEPTPPPDRIWSAVNLG